MRHGKHAPMQLFSCLDEYKIFQTLLFIDNYNLVHENMPEYEEELSKESEALKMCITHQVVLFLTRSRRVSRKFHQKQVKEMGTELYVQMFGIKRMKLLDVIMLMYKLFIMSSNRLLHSTTRTVDTMHAKKNTKNTMKRNKTVNL